MTVRPSLTMSVMIFHRKRRALGSMPVVGSSCYKQNIVMYICTPLNYDVGQYSMYSTVQYSLQQLMVWLPFRLAQGTVRWSVLWPGFNSQAQMWTHM
jgi:hypothetical protein